jgi:predicted ATPase
MPELTTDFTSLPEEYQRVIQLAQSTHNITVAPLELLVGGWSGAVVYLVSVSYNENKRVEHCILKLDRKSKNAKSDEVTRHHTMMDKSTPEFARDHIAELVFDRVEHEGAIAIFYRIAGQSLLKYLPLSKYERQNQLKTIFEQTNKVLVEEWNKNQAFEQAVHPQKVLEKWLGFRLDTGGNIEQFLESICKVNPDVAGLLVNGHVFPNPLLYARKPEAWGRVRSIDIAAGFIHGDLNTNNILVKFSNDKETIEGYYLIDFALFKENMPLFYDQRYLEMSYLMHSMSQVFFGKYVDFLTLLAVADVPDSQKVPIGMSGVSTVIGSARDAFAEWVEQSHPSLHDDLWGQYWLAGVAAGLAYCHKAGQPDEARLAGLIYAAANLRRYASAFNLPLPARVELLYDENASDSDSPRTGKKPKHNLPAQPTPFIGRGAQIAAVKELLQRDDARLVTLLGPGGTGKTRLSLQVAQELFKQFSHGVFFVPLADDTNSDQLISRIAQQLEVREGGRLLFENVKDFLREKQVLLVLDNFEQLVSAAPTVADLLASAPQLKIITSSRIALKLQSEREYQVPPLDLPQTDANIEELSGYESVRLFVERARSAHSGFSLTKDNASAVTEICRRLDGLPLALELAAARIKLLSPQAILSRLDDQLKLLTGGSRDLPTRHQTLRNTLEWSYSLLSENEKQLYARLGVFVGGFTFEAAEAICNAGNKFDILDSLTALVDNSLLRQEEMPDGDSRFSMLETIRAYAVERLAESGETQVLQANHAQYFGNIIINQAGWGIYSPKSQYWLTWYERELDNIRATLSWCLTTPDGIQMGVMLIFMLFWFWYRRGQFTEGQQWAEKFLAIPDLRNIPPLHATTLASSGILALWQGQQETALRKLSEALSIELQLEDDRMVAMTQMANGIAFINMGRDSEAQPLLEQASSYFKEVGMSYFQGLTLVHLGNAELGLGHPQKAHAYHSEAESAARTLNENWLISFALNNLGEVARTQGQYDLARKYYEECEALLPDSGDKGDRARFVHSLGYIAQHEGDYERTESQFRKSLVMFRQLGNRRGMAECMAGLAGLKARQGNAEWGAIMLSAAEAALKLTGGEWWPADRIEVDANHEVIRSALSEVELTTAEKKGKAMNLEQALAFASEQS